MCYTCRVGTCIIFSAIDGKVLNLFILYVVVNPKLNFQLNATETLTACNRSLFALRTIKHHGLDEHMLQVTFKATTLAKLLYASPVWSGFLSRSLLDRYKAFLRRAMRFSFYSPSGPCFEALLASADQNLFKKVLNNEEHVLYPKLPPEKSTGYFLRSTTLARCFAVKDDHNFLNRLLFSRLYNAK